MKRRSRVVSLGVSISLIVCSLAMTAMAQQAAIVTSSASAVPRVVNYSGSLKDLSGRPLSSITGVTFLLYKDEQGGAPLWLETQSVQPDKAGHYTVMLGSV